MKKLKKIKGHTTPKYGTTYTQEQQKINELIDAVKELQNEVINLKKYKL